MYSWYRFNQKRYRERPGRYTNQPAFKDKQFEKDFNEWLTQCEFITSEEYKYNANPIPAQRRSQFTWVNPNIDLIGKVEDLPGMLQTLNERGVIDGRPSSLGVVNSTPVKAPYWKVYSKESRHWIEEHFHHDIEYGEYRFHTENE